MSGALLWLGERDTALRLPGTLALHDAATLLLAALVAGHIWMALSRPQSLEGIRRGTVPARYAAEHHPKWRAPPPPSAAAERPVVALARIVAAATRARAARRQRPRQRVGNGP